MLAQTCWRLETLDLGAILFYSELLEDICRGHNDAATRKLAGDDDDDGANAGKGSVVKDAAKGGWRIYRDGSKKQSIVGPVAAASLCSLFVRLHTLHALIHPNAAPKLVALLAGGRVADLTLRFAGGGGAAVRGIAAVARLGPQLRRLALQLCGYPQQAAALRPLRALTELRTLGVSFSAAPFSAVQPFREHAVSPAFAAATDEHWRYIAAGMRRLRRLSLRMRDCLTLRTLCIVGEACPQLEALSLAAPCDVACLADTAATVVFPALRQLRVNCASLLEPDAEM
jgi:hypothetical protein